MALPSTCASASSYCDTDSSNESFESDSSSHVNISNNSNTLEHAKWTEQIVDNQNFWKQTEKNNVWSEESNKSWKTSSSEDRSLNWPLRESGSESFYKSLMQTPIIPCDFPAPKPDSPPEVFSLINSIFICIFYLINFDKLFFKL